MTNKQKLKTIANIFIFSYSEYKSNAKEKTLPNPNRTKAISSF
jgi:hypothetical protein